MSECQISPKRKASRALGSPPKRTNLDSDSGIPRLNSCPSTINRVMDVSDQRLMPDVSIRLHSGHLTMDRTTRIESRSSHSRDNPTTIVDEGPLIIAGNNGQMPTPPSSEDDLGDIEDVFPPCKIRPAIGGSLSGEFSPLEDFSPLQISSDEDTEESGYHLPSKEYVELHVVVRVTRFSIWAKVIEVSCTYAGEEVAYASGHLICRDLIRDNFYESMDSLEKPTSDRIDELLDHHGYFRWSIKEYYLREKVKDWNNDLETGSILQINEVLVGQEWQSQALGALMVTSLIDRAEKRDCCAQFAFVLPSTGCFWQVDESGCTTYDQSRGSAEQNHVRVFLGVGFTRAAETGWFVLDITAVDEDPGVELEKGESKSSQHKIWMAGLK